MLRAARRRASSAWRRWCWSPARGCGLLHDLISLQAIAPGMTNLIRWQTHRYVLRQSVAYFASDFAGRIASNIMQTGVSMRDSVIQVIDALWFVAVFVSTALAILASADWRLAAAASALGRGLRGRARLFRARVRRPLAAIGGPARDADRPDRRQLRQHSNSETVLASRARGRPRPRGLQAHTDAYRSQTRILTRLNLVVSLINSLLLVVTTARGGRTVADGRGLARRSRGRHRPRASAPRPCRCG